MERMSRAARALAVSLGLHGFLLLIVCFIPGPRRDSSDFQEVGNVSELKLQLIDEPAAVVPKLPAAEEEQHDLEAEYKVTIGDNSVAAAAPASLTAPVLLPSGPAGRIGGSSAPASNRSPCLLEAPRTANRVVYVLDRSLSMGLNGALARARREVLAALARLPKNATFQVILYNRQTEPLRPGGRIGYLTADESTRTAVAAALDKVVAAGNTDHRHALQHALQLRPDVIFFVTDADDLDDGLVREITHLNAGYSAIHTVELSRTPAGADGPLCRLAVLNHGTFRQASPRD